MGRPKIHGWVGTPEHDAWCALRQRCFNPKASGFERYGGRGIKVCERWNRFENFLADMGTRPSPKHSVERLDNNGDYTPENCKWSTLLEQTNNRKSNHRIVINGVTKTLSEWCRHYGQSLNMVSHRLRLGWEPEKALKTKKGQ